MKLISFATLVLMHAADAQDTKAAVAARDAAFSRAYAPSAAWEPD